VKTVYLLTPAGWMRVQRCQSFEHACRVARELQASHPRLLLLRQLMKTAVQWLCLLAVSLLMGAGFAWAA
jgi:hypothetical protein